jgi:AraC family transcriptional regulator
MIRPSFVSNVQSRTETVALRYESVERVIQMMSERLDRTFSLEDMAEIAMLSPYHFNRVFRQITGIPPSQFLCAVRLQTAKKLLLTTHLSVTEVCYTVGYNSLGTFVSRFTQLVGLSPTHLRRLVKQMTPSNWESLCQHFTTLARIQPLSSGINGRIKVSDPTSELIFVGLFLTPIPQSRPVYYTFLTAPGSYRMAPVPDNRYYIITSALTWSQDPLTMLLQEAVLYESIGPVEVANGQLNKPTDVTLRPKCLTDPPLLTALPFLLTE